MDIWEGAYMNLYKHDYSYRRINKCDKNVHASPCVPYITCIWTALAVLPAALRHDDLCTTPLKFFRELAVLSWHLDRGIGPRGQVQMSGGVTSAIPRQALCPNRKVPGLRSIMFSDEYMNELAISPTRAAPSKDSTCRDRSLPGSERQLSSHTALGTALSAAWLQTVVGIGDCNAPALNYLKSWRYSSFHDKSSTQMKYSKYPIQAHSIQAQSRYRLTFPVYRLSPAKSSPIQAMAHHDTGTQNSHISLYRILAWQAFGGGKLF